MLECKTSTNALLVVSIGAREMLILTSRSLSLAPSEGFVIPTFLNPAVPSTTVVVERLEELLGKVVKVEIEVGDGLVLYCLYSKVPKIATHSPKTFSHVIVSLNVRTERTI